MKWEELVGHERQYEWFRTADSAGRMASSFLLIGPAGIGKRTFARLIAQSLLCQHGGQQGLQHCGRCEDCAQVDASTHPDLIEVAKPPDKAFIPTELLIGEREKRNRAGLCHDISLRPYSGRRKIAILDDADALNAEGANSLLKTLEEPPADSLLFLIGTSLQRQLPTIRSRCQAIIFRPLSTDQLAGLLMRLGRVESPEAAVELAKCSGGSLDEALLLADPELHEFQSSLMTLLSARQLAMSELAKGCEALVDAAGKDAKARRERLKLLLRMAAGFYRGMTLRQSSETHAETDDQQMVRAVDRACQHWTRGPQAALACWKRCLLAMEQVDRNANQASLLEAWSADMAQLSGR